MLVNIPKRVKVDTTYDQNLARRQVTFIYDITAKLTKLGNELYGIAKEIDQLGGIILGISFVGEIQTFNDEPDNRNPHGRWRAMSVCVRVAPKSKETEHDWEKVVTQLIGDK